MKVFDDPKQEKKYRQELKDGKRVFKSDEDREQFEERMRNLQVIKAKRKEQKEKRKQEKLAKQAAVGNVTLKDFHRKVFYKELPDGEYKIMGMSDGEVSMEFPYVEVEIPYHSTENLKVFKKKGKIELGITKGAL